MNSQNSLLAQNKKALFDYEIVETFEVGIELKGYEVKAARQGKVNLKGSYVSTLNGQLYLKGCHISPLWSLPNSNLIESRRERKLFLHKKEILSLHGKTLEPGKSLLPIEMYLKWSLIKVRIWLGIGRKKYDKKQLLKERSMDKEIKRKLKDYDY